MSETLTSWPGTDDISSSVVAARLRQAEACTPCAAGAAVRDTPAFENLTTATLAQISRDKGVDFATELLYHCISRAPWNEPFLNTLNTMNLDAPNPRPMQLLIAPGALYREQPRFGSDGRVVSAVAAELGWRSRVLEVDSMGSVVGNAEMIARAIAAEPQAVVVASLSKGGADVRVALERHPELCDKIACWLNICGLVRGTPISDSLLGTRWWQRGLLTGYLAYTNADTQFVTDLAATPGSLLGEPISAEIAGRVRIINVVGFPLCEHLQGSSRMRHQRMAHLGPNDGTSLLRDSMVLPGLVCPVWGADHFLRASGVESLLRRLLRYVEGLR